MSPITKVLFNDTHALHFSFHIHFVVERIYEVVHLLALRFNVKFAVSFHAVVYFCCKFHPKAERNKKKRRYSFTTMKHDLKGSWHDWRRCKTTHQWSYFLAHVDYHRIDIALFQSAQVDFFKTKQNTSNSPVQFCPFPVYPSWQ